MTADLKPYPAYKDTGMPWLGDVPAHWETQRADSRLAVTKCPIHPSEISNRQVLHYSIPNVQRFGKGAVEPGSSIDSDKILVDRTLLLVSKLNPRKGTIALAEPDPTLTTLASSEFVAMQPKHCIGRFAKYLYTSEHVKLELSARVDSATKSHQRCSPEDISKLQVSWPPLPEQTAIVRFLDHADRRIQRYIRAKQKLIALLEEQKQAIIHQAVTGKIDVRTGQPYPVYKSSGIEWLEDVPKHWELRRLKQCAHTISKGTTPSTEGRNILEIGPVRFLKAENITSRGIVHYPSHFIDEETNALLRRSQLMDGDVLFVIAGATLGKTSVVVQEVLPANTNQAVAFIRPDKRILSSYLVFFLQSPRVEEATWLNAVQSAQPNLSMTDLGNFCLPLPSLPEQSAIVEHLEDATSELATVVSHVRRQVALLQEYDTRLIADVVTGKLDVCEAATTLPEIDLLAADDELDEPSDVVAAENSDGPEAVPEEAQA